MRGPEYCFSSDLEAGGIRWSITWNRNVEGGLLLRATAENYVLQQRPKEWYREAQIDVRNGDAKIGGLILKAIRDLRVGYPRVHVLQAFF